MCTHDPRIYKNLPIGMYHCPECGEMVIAGLEHQPPEDDMNSKMTSKKAVGSHKAQQAPTPEAS